MLGRVDSPGSLLSDSIRDESFHSFCPRITDVLLASSSSSFSVVL